MKYIKPYNTIFYLTSSGGCGKDMMKNIGGIKSLLHISLHGGFCQISDTCPGHENPSACKMGDGYKWIRNETAYWKDNFNIDVNFFDMECNFDLEKLKEADIIFIHGGDINEIVKNAAKISKELKEAILNCKIYVGLSAGSVLMSKNSFLPADGGEVMQDILGEDLLNIGIFDFGVDVHIGFQLNNPVYMNNLYECAEKYKGDFYLIPDGSYLKIIDGNIETVGTVYTREDL